MGGMAIWQPYGGRQRSWDDAYAGERKRAAVVGLMSIVDKGPKAKPIVNYDTAGRICTTSCMYALIDMAYRILDPGPYWPDTGHAQMTCQGGSVVEFGGVELVASDEIMAVRLLTGSRFTREATGGLAGNTAGMSEEGRDETLTLPSTGECCCSRGRSEEHATMRRCQCK